VYVLLEFWQKIMAIPIMNPLSWFMIASQCHCIIIPCAIHLKNMILTIAAFQVLSNISHYDN